MDVTISGTRATTHQHRHFYQGVFGSFLFPLTKVEFNCFYVGGARGIDQLALGFLLEQQVGHRTTIVVPKKVEDQPKDVQALIFTAISKHGSKLVELNRLDFPSPAAYHARNDYMVDRSHFVAAFPLAGGGKTGGTWQVIKTAIERDMPRVVVPVPGGVRDLMPELPLASRR